MEKENKLTKTKKLTPSITIKQKQGKDFKKNWCKYKNKNSQIRPQSKEK